ncbi:MAG TPA: beta-hydroxyacyl-ACP dehydratase, partial [Pirellulales bacterium]|nr:beta-hydroxyacyl-ACP dehydratase [Pirellulales bacterium]
DRRIAAGYKDYGHDEWWARGHMPGMPLLPGVLICEAAAQLCSYQCRKHRLMGETMLGFGGMDEVRFRDVVLPGSRLVVVAQGLKFRPVAMIVCRFQAFVNQSLVGEGQIRGIPLPIDRLKEASVSSSGE